MSENPQGAAPRGADDLADGWSHKLTPLVPFDVTKADSVSAMLERMKQTAFGARRMGEAVDVLHAMVSDPKCFVVATFTGAMTIAKMGLLIAEMIDQKMIDAVVSTGALMCHGMIEQTGHTHFQYDPKWNDTELFEAGYARVYDTLELEQNLDNAEVIVRAVLSDLPEGEPFGSFELNRRLGEHLNQHYPGRGILQSAAKMNVPVYVPAFTDSELGLDVYTFNLLAQQRGLKPINFTPLRDIHDYATRAMAAERLGIFTIGGGVPRNWAQQVGPLAELLHRRSGGTHGGMARFQYAVRVCPEPAHWGGLSGCTYSEGVSWGKFIPPEEGGRFAEVFSDATIAWPLIVRAVLERMGRV